MKVKELIAKLQELDQEKEIESFDSTGDTFTIDRIEYEKECDTYIIM